MTAANQYAPLQVPDEFERHWNNPVKEMQRELPDSVCAILREFVGGLTRILSAKLYGIYMHGATVFPDAGPILDIDCHVVLNEAITYEQRQAILELNHYLDKEFPLFGGAPDAYFVLLEEARKTLRPKHHLNEEMCDDSWALHCAHVRAGRYETLWGPEPTDIFPVPSFEQIDTDLMGQLDYIKEHLCYEAYCVLNLCRIIYSYSEGNVVVSKQFSGSWAKGRFPEWRKLIEAAIRYNQERRYFTGKSCPEEDRLLKDLLPDFLSFSLDYIDKIR